MIKYLGHVFGSWFGRLSFSLCSSKMSRILAKGHSKVSSRLICVSYNYVVLQDPNNPRGYLHSGSSQQPLNPVAPLGGVRPTMPLPHAGAQFAHFQTRPIFATDASQNVINRHQVPLTLPSSAGSSIGIANIASSTAPNISSNPQFGGQQPQVRS